MKKWIIVFLLGFGIVVLGGCGSIPTGDGGSLKINNDGISLKSGDGKGGEIDIKTKDGEMVISGTDEEGKEFQQKVTSQQKLPDDFPQDMPIPSDVEFTLIESDMGEQMQYMVSYSVKGKVVDYYNQYRQYVDEAGYSQITDASKGNAAEDTAIENIMAKSDGYSLFIGIMKSGTGKYDDGSVAINLMYMFDKQ